MAPPSLAATTRGRFGESEAWLWYRARGYDLIERNWRCPSGELDLIVATGDLTVFCEVKARASDRWGGPELAVDWRKQQRLRRLAAQFLTAHPQRRGPIRFDVVAVTGTQVEVFEDAF